VNLILDVSGTMKDLQFFDEIEYLVILLSRVRDIFMKARDIELMPHGLTRSQTALLNVIYHIGGSARVSEISKYIFRERHSTHEILSRAEKAGLVERSADPDRKKGIIVKLTTKGRKAYYDTRKQSVYQIMSSLSREQLKQLRSCLETLRENALKETGIKDRLPFSLSVVEQGSKSRHKAKM
jgi:DNA-binding MarR family transcriptional regulator